MPENKRNIDTKTGQEKFCRILPLTLSEWIAVVILLTLVSYVLPYISLKTEPVGVDENKRLPYELNNDYWLIKQCFFRACSEQKRVVMGDSFVWGTYVEANETLTAHLNSSAAGNRFVNLGLNGGHPVALYGLLKHYCEGVTDSKIILHFNPVWLCNRKYDLQSAKPFNVNRPHLIPQFFIDIPAYKASINQRLDEIIKREVSFFSWARHFRLTRFQKEGKVVDLSTWMLENPYTSPLGKLFRGEVLKDAQRQVVLKPGKNLSREDFPWVSLDGSFQWSYLLKLINLLKKRGNEVFVVVGPLNEGTLSERSLSSYKKLKTEMEKRLIEMDIDYYIPEALTGNYYADVSHLRSEGYAILAERLLMRAELYQD